MIYPIVPIFMTQVLKASITAVGLVEGIAESTAALTKFIFGYLSDKFQKRKPFVNLGYTFSAFSKAVIGLATAWPLVLFSRFLDQLGKGLRTGARDVLLLQNTNEKNKGYIFGFHRSLDSAGAVLGPILSLILIYFFANNLRLIFYLATIPGFLAVLLLILLVHEKKVDNLPKTSQKFIFSWKFLNPKVKLFFAYFFYFCFRQQLRCFFNSSGKKLRFNHTIGSSGLCSI